MPKQGPLNRPVWGTLQALRVRICSAPTKQSFRDVCRGKTRCSIQTLWNFSDWRIHYFFIHNTFYCTVIWRTLYCEWYKKKIGLWAEDSEPRASAWRYWWASNEPVCGASCIYKISPFLETDHYKLGKVKLRMKKEEFDVLSSKCWIFTIA